MPRAEDKQGWDSLLAPYRTSAREIMHFLETADLTPAIRARCERITHKRKPTDDDIEWLAGVCAPESDSSYLLLDACRRLKIPSELIKSKVYPHLRRHPSLVHLEQAQPIVSFSDAAVEMPPFTPPAWDVFHQSEGEYRRYLKEKLDGYVEFIVGYARLSMERKGWKFRGAHRAGDIPLEVRYEWAAERLCFEHQYQDIAATAAVKYPRLFRKNAKFDPGTDRVKNAVRSVFKQLRITDGT